MISEMQMEVRLEPEDVEMIRSLARDPENLRHGRIHFEFRAVVNGEFLKDFRELLKKHLPEESVEKLNL